MRTGDEVERVCEGVTMIAKRRRLAMHDFLLIVIATGVIVVSFLPLAPPRREVRIRDAAGDMRTYSLELHDPTWKRLQAQTAQTRQQKTTSSALAVAKWQAEVAGFYAEQTKPRQILQVSFRDHRDVESENVPMRMQHEAWLRVRDEAQLEINRWENSFQNLQILDTPRAVEIGDFVPPHRTARAYAIALIGGLLVAAVFALWALLAPSIQLPTEPTNETNRVPADPDRAFDFACTVPRDWIRVRQSASVWLRRAAEATLVIVALGILVTSR